MIVLKNVFIYLHLSRIGKTFCPQGCRCSLKEFPYIFTYSVSCCKSCNIEAIVKIATSAKALNATEAIKL